MKIDSYSDERIVRTILYDVDVLDMGLKPNELSVYMHICRRAAGGKGVCFAKQSTIANDAQMSTRAVIRAAKTLEELNMIRVNRRVGYGNHYTLTDKTSWIQTKTDRKRRADCKAPPHDYKSHAQPMTTSHTPHDYKSHPPMTTSHTPMTTSHTMKKTPKVNKIKKTHERESAHTARAPRPKTETEKSPLREAFELHYEGEADNEKAMGGLVKLAEKWGVTVESLSSFMKWMEAYYPSKRFIIYGFKDHYQEFMLVKGRNPKETAQQRAAREYNESTAELQKRIKAAEAAEAAQAAEAAESHSVSTMACKEPLKTSLKVQQESKPTDMERWVKLREEKIKLTKQKTMDPIPTKGNTQEERDEEWVEKRKRELHKLAKKAERLTVVKTAQN